MNRIDRLFGILTFLQSKRYVPAEDIREKFQISIRTIYRDLKAIGELGIPVGFEAGKGYYVMQGYFLPPVSFTTEEANALLLMESLVYGFADKSIQTHYTNALNKMKAVMRTSQKEQLESLNNNIRLQMPPCINHDYEYLSIIQNAIAFKRILDIEYKNNAEESSSRLVEPIGLVFYALNWHLIAWCHKRQDYRDFRISRIVKLTRTERPFRKTDHMELNDYMLQIPVSY